MVTLNQNEINQLTISVSTLPMGMSYVFIFMSEVTRKSVTIIPTLLQSNVRYSLFTVNLLTEYWLTPPGSWRLDVWSTSDPELENPDGVLLTSQQVTLVASCPQEKFIKYDVDKIEYVVYTDDPCAPSDCLTWDTLLIWNLTQQTWNCG